MNREERFNKIFSTALMALMTLVIVYITVANYGQTPPGRERLLLLAAAIASLCGITSTVLSANARIANFFFGILNVAVYGAVCFIKGNYGNAAINLLYFLPMQFVGLASWRRRGDGKKRIRARRLTPRQRTLFLALFLLGSVITYLVLAWIKAEAGLSFREALLGSDGALRVLRWVIVVDALATVCNLIGQYLLSTAYMEQWFFWIVVNISSVVMWSLTAAGDAEAGRNASLSVIYIVKYAFYLVNALNGLRIWLNLSRPEGAENR